VTRLTIIPLALVVANLAHVFAAAPASKDYQIQAVPSIPGYAYAHRDSTLFVNLFISGRTTVEMEGREVTLQQETRYPWEGQVRITLQPDSQGTWELAIRIPGWTGDHPLPGGSYRFINGTDASAGLTVNGRPVKAPVEQGYARLHRTWVPGDIVTVDLPLAPRRVVTDTKVEANLGQVAIQRGPIVFCAEGIDQPVPHTANLLLPDTANAHRERTPMRVWFIRSSEPQNCSAALTLTSMTSIMDESYT